MASDQGLQCLLTGLSIKNRLNHQNRPDTLEMTNGLVQHITVEESTSIQLVKVSPAFSSHLFKDHLAQIQIKWTFYGSSVLSSQDRFGCISSQNWRKFQTVTGFPSVSAFLGWYRNEDNKIHIPNSKLSLAWSLCQTLFNHQEKGKVLWENVLYEQFTQVSYRNWWWKQTWHLYWFTKLLKHYKPRQVNQHWHGTRL